MNEKLKKLLDSINARKQKVKDLVAAGKLDEAETEKELLKADQKKFDLLYDLDEGDDGDGAGAAGAGTPAGKKDAGTGDPDDDPAPPTAKQVGTALVAAIRARLKGKKAPAEAAAILKRDAELRAEMVEGTPGEDDGEDGGLTVPQDISTQINELRRATAENL